MNLQRISEKFWSKVDVTVDSKCWVWKNSKDKWGYGKFGVDRKIVRAPRVAFFLRNGRWPNHACHRCDNPSCVNPAHIYDGNPKTNAEDREKRFSHKRPSVCGEKSGRSILTENQVLRIRREYKETGIGMIALSKKYGCSLTNIQHITARKSWTHI